jgi:hypothetical protein
MDILSNSKFLELKEGFLKLFNLKINGVISSIEEQRRKELAIEYLKLSDVEKGVINASNVDYDDDSESDDGECSQFACGKCADGFLRQIFVFFRLIDDDVSSTSL